ncbi:unnamed protein product, partial [Brassica rapa]
QTDTHTDVQGVLKDTHGRHVCADGHPRTQSTWAKITQIFHGKGQRAESKDQRSDICTDGRPRTSSTDVMCVMTDIHGWPVCADGHPRTSFHGKGQRADSNDQRADMCTDGQPRTSCVC